MKIWGKNLLVGKKGTGKKSEQFLTEIWYLTLHGVVKQDYREEKI